ncbi:MAG: EAL domain-containing protein [Lachnospiraceae bacterium]|nr:EAL domain-containing protein [Lachnospiraceae bacterium]
MNGITIPDLIDGAGFQISTIVMCIAGIFFMAMRVKPEKTHTKLFMCLLVDVMLSAVCNLVSAFAKPFVMESDIAFNLRVFSQYPYFILHFLLAPLFCVYVIYLTGLNYGLGKTKHALILLPGIIMILMAVINPLTKWIYYFDEAREYHRSIGMIAPYIISAGYYLGSMVTILFFWRLLNRKRKIVMIFFFVVITIGVLVQLLLAPAHTELLMEALGLAGIMVTIGNEEDLIDQRYHIYNHQALEYDLNVFQRVGRSFCMIVIKLTNSTIVSRLSGMAGVGAVTQLNTSYLTGLVPRKSVYLAGIGSFAIIAENTDPQYNLSLARKIKERYEHSWHVDGRDVKYNAIVLCVEIPKDFNMLEDIMALINSPVNGSLRAGNDVLSGESLHYILRQNRVENAIINGLENKSFEVYYQPIYKTTDLGIYACEALVRLHDDEFGDIYPDEFLPMAERSGMIFDLGEFVVNEVCSFLNSGIPTEMGIETIGINLSVSQCIHPSYADRIINTVGRYTIDPQRITFEITETAAAADIDSLKGFIARLKNAGFKFGVDNFGIGFSSISITSSLDIDIVKIDKAMLWEAEKSQVGKIILENTVAMIKKLGKQILISGIETKSQIDIAKDFEVDLLQGFYFSNPVSQNELISILKATQIARFEEQKALAASEAMSNFLASMSHEIRTPINAVLGMDEMILRECGDGKILEYAQNIEGAGRTLLSLINDILDLSKLEAGNFEINEGRYELSSLISDVMNMIQFKADDKGLDLRCEVDPNTPEGLWGDETRIRQILLNLMNNAVKYTEKGSVSLKVGYEKTGKDTIKLMLSVKDTGIGIKEDDKEKVFDKFKRFDTDRNKTVEGSGLGLAITSQLIRNMNGVIDVESVYGQGSTFYCIIPQKIVSRTAIGDFRKDAAKISVDPEKNTVRFVAPKAEILVVDDTPMNIAVVRALLKRTMVQMDEATSGPECLEKLDGKDYDLVLLDYRMPEMDGIEVLKNIRAKNNNPNSKIPVIALTANAISGAREKFIGEGFDDYITKPVDGLKLEKLLMVYLPAEKIELNVGGASKAGDAADNVRKNAESKETDENGAEPSNDSSDTDLLSEYIDRETGIRNCGSEEIFESIFKIFTDDVDNKCSNVRSALKSNDIKRYTVEVHALKSSARIVGAVKIAELAAELEAAGDRNDLERINADTEKLLSMYEKCRTKEENTKKGDEIGKETWRDALETIKEFASLMDYDNASMVLKSLDEYEMSSDKEQLKKELRILVDALKWEEVTESIDQILAE